VDLAEPLASLDDNQPATMAAELLRSRNLQVLGVRHAGSMTGWVQAEDMVDGSLGEHARPFREELVLDETASLDAVLCALTMTGHVFVRWLGDVAGVITRRDLQKPPLRMWLFGAITILDLNMTNAIESLHPADSWRDRISQGRLDKALALRAERQRCGADCRLVDCLQIKDKADILVRDSTNLSALGFSSRREAERFSRDIEALRNHLAHAQELEAAHLVTAAQIATLITSILQAEGVQRIIEARRHMESSTPQ
jgi:hypothetical protein